MVEPDTSGDRSALRSRTGSSRQLRRGVACPRMGLSTHHPGQLFQSDEKCQLMLRFIVLFGVGIFMQA